MENVTEDTSTFDEARDDDFNEELSGIDDVDGGRSVDSVEPTAVVAKLSMRGVRYFFTVPRCGKDKICVIRDFKRICSCVWMVWSTEDHRDREGTHLHGFVQFKTPPGSVRANYFDKVCGGHPHIEPVRSVKKSLRYVVKDGDYEVDGITKEEVRAMTDVKMKVGEEVAMMVLKKRKLYEITLLHPDYMLRNLKKVKEFSEFVMEQEEQKNKLSRLDLMDLEMPMAIKSWKEEEFESYDAIYKWFRGCSCHTARRKQLWIYGPPDIGKTYFMSILDRYFYTYKLPLNEEFYDFYSDDCSFVFIDEFKGQLPAQVLFQWLDGQRMCLRMKGCQYMKRWPKPMVICSNYSPEEAYSGLKDIQYVALMSRVVAVKVNKNVMEKFNRNLDNALMKLSLFVHKRDNPNEESEESTQEIESEKE